MKALSLTLLAALASLNLLISPVRAETSAEDFFQQGQIFAGQKSYAKAQESYLQALAIDPKFEKAYISLALIYSLKKEFPKALVQLDTVLKLNPKAAMPHKIKGLIFRDQGKLPESIAALQNYLKAVPPEQLKAKDRAEIEALIAKLEKDLQEKEKSAVPTEGGQ